MTVCLLSNLARPWEGRGGQQTERERERDIYNSVMPVGPHVIPTQKHTRACVCVWYCVCVCVCEQKCIQRKAACTMQVHVQP